MINLFFSSSDAGTSKLYAKEFGIDNEQFISLSFGLHTGNIKEPFSVSSRRVTYDLYYDEWNSIVSDDIRELKKLIKKDNEVCIWFSTSDTDRYLGMLASVEWLSQKGVSIYLCDHGAFFDEYHSDEEAVDFQPFERHMITGEEKTKYMSELQHLKEENAALRSIIDGKVVSLPADYIDDKIFKAAGTEDIRVSQIVYEIISKILPRHLMFITCRIRQLVDMGEFEIIKYGKLTTEVYGGGDDFMKSVIRRRIQ